MKNKDLKEFREGKGYSQSEFSEIMGCSQPAISKAESRPEDFVSNNLYKKFKEKFGADQTTTNTTTTDDPEVNIEFSLRMKQSQFEQFKHQKAKVDLTQLFTLV